MRLPFTHDRRPPAAQAAPAAQGVAASPPAAPPPPQIDLIARAFELANDDWTEQEAAEELARLAEGDRARLLEAYERLVALLIRTAVIDRRGVRATRVVSRATRLVSTGQ